ncbi:Stigma-specific STIG1-like protein 3 [Linum perenne]
MTTTVLLKTMLLIFVLTALSVTLTMRTINHEEEEATPTTTNRVSRFLKEETTSTGSADAADHCNKDPGLCESLYGKGFSCCNNKCKNLNVDKQNCGACKNKCDFKDECCRGECVFLALDKRHCGRCNSPCAPGQPCVYGLCNYA